ncbi:hypothetical protein A2U01_0116677, partial [Trifolium medium]|nr:hypothetical protein [Trifolium medium]
MLHLGQSSIHLTGGGDNDSTFTTFSLWRPSVPQPPVKEDVITR